MNKALFIVGPTAIGKTNLAFDIAKKFSGELVSCDSVQVYKSLNIVSGKDISPKISFIRINEIFPILKDKFDIGYYKVNDIPVHLLDVVYPYYSFNISDYVGIAIPIIKYVQQKNKLPIIVGGAGFYAKALLDGIDTLSIPQNEKLRKELEKQTVNQLQNILIKEDPKRFKTMNESDKKNKRRLIRAIEVVRCKRISDCSALPRGSEVPGSRFKKIENSDVLIIGLYTSREFLRERINKRVEEWLRNGAMEEVKRLFKDYKKLSNQVKTAVGYRQLFDYCLDKSSFEEAVKRVKIAERQYAKKQMTFFRKDKRIQWFDITNRNFETDIIKIIRKWRKS